jgi:AraC family transcriptional regulator
MSNHHAFVTRLGKYLGLKDVPFHTSRMGNASMGVTRLRSDNPCLGMTDVIPAEDSYLICVQMGKHTVSLWTDNHFTPPQQLETNSLCFVHLERDTRPEFYNSFDIVQFYIPRLSLDEIAQDFGARKIDALRCPPLGATDHTITQLTGCLLPSLSGKEDVCGPFVDHILLALQAHVARKYGEMKFQFRRSRESLAPWQVHRAKELMASRISGSLSLAELAGECQLSVSHFARAFKKTIGVAPHRWLVEQKMERAKQLLESTSLTVTDIALECGFSHRVALSNAFQRMNGVNPGEWRRARQTSRRSHSA